MSFSKNLKTLIKYAVLTLIGILLFQIGAAQALAFRGYHAIGGEVFFLFIPVFYWIISTMIRDFKKKKKKEKEWSGNNDPV